MARVGELSFVALEGARTAWGGWRADWVSCAASARCAVRESGPFVSSAPLATSPACTKDTLPRMEDHLQGRLCFETHTPRETSSLPCVDLQLARTLRSRPLSPHDQHRAHPSPSPHHVGSSRVLLPLQVSSKSPRDPLSEADAASPATTLSTFSTGPHSRRLSRKEQLQKSSFAVFSHSPVGE